jgi:hypothetical protein
MSIGYESGQVVAPDGVRRDLKDAASGDSSHAHVMVGPQAHWAKVAFERMFLTTRKRGRVML